MKSFKKILSIIVLFGCIGYVSTHTTPPVDTVFDCILFFIVIFGSMFLSILTIWND